MMQAKFYLKYRLGGGGPELGIGVTAVPDQGVMLELFTRPMYPEPERPFTTMDLDRTVPLSKGEARAIASAIMGAAAEL